LSMSTLVTCTKVTRPQSSVYTIFVLVRFLAFIFLLLRRPLGSTLFPYTTLFRSTGYRNGSPASTPLGCSGHGRSRITSGQRRRLRRRCSADPPPHRRWRPLRNASRSWG